MGARGPLSIGVWAGVQTGYGTVIVKVETVRPNSFSST